MEIDPNFFNLDLTRNQCIDEIFRDPAAIIDQVINELQDCFANYVEHKICNFVENISGYQI